MKFSKPIKVILMYEAESYLAEVNTKMQLKIVQNIQKTEVGIKGKWYKKLT